MFCLTLAVLEVDSVTVEPITAFLTSGSSSVVDAPQTLSSPRVTSQTIAHVDVSVTITPLTSAVDVTRLAPPARRAPANQVNITLAFLYNFGIFCTILAFFKH